jgi:5'-methylthioadenosine phosphorylase
VSDIRIGVLGGSGLYEMAGLTIREERVIPTPFGDPSDALMLGDLDGVPIAFMARHGRGHRLMPTELNFRANIWAFKSLGCETLISASAVGSMKLEYAPTDIVIPDQFIDRTRHRVDTFFGDGIVAHVSFADPICNRTAALLGEAGRKVGAKIHVGGTYLCMEGPQFSTRAESNLYRSWGVDIIGMTNLQEAKLAREAEICYATIGLVTDYDCWHETEEAVTVEQVIGYLNKNAKTACELIRDAVGRVASSPRDCFCGSALQYALITHPSKITKEAKERLALLVGRYLP